MESLWHLKKIVTTDVKKNQHQKETKNKRQTRPYTLTIDRQ